MKLALFINIPSHYQIALGKAFAEKLKEKFTLVFWEPLHEDRKRLGWKDEFEEEWLINAWHSEEHKAAAYNILRDADIAVWGSGPPASAINERVNRGKLTFRYSERLFKQSWRILDPRVLYALRKTYKFANRKTYHLLSVGPYCADDFRLIGAFSNRMWRWGYFPEVAKNNRREKSQTEPVILWAGRMLSWKRVDLLLHAVAWARAQGCGRFTLRLIGNGPEEDRLRSLAVRLGLTDICEFCGSQSPEAVGIAMEQADIYVLPSSRQEGWGAVVNEAMTRGCCVVGNKPIGSVPYLIHDGVNGCVFESKSAENLGGILRWCIDNPERRNEMGRVASATISRFWSPGVAAERLLQLCEALQMGKTSPYSDEGPCSPA